MASSIIDLCRITVVGPARRVDLAVPATMPLVELVPQLTRFVVQPDGQEPDAVLGSWVVQRLGDAPFGPSATPESAGWLDGEVLHLMPAEQPLPALDFDDVADAVATSVDRQSDRWNPTAQRVLFGGLAVVAAALVAVEALRTPAAVAGTVLALLALVVGIGCVVGTRFATPPGLVVCGTLASCAAGSLAVSVLAVSLRAGVSGQVAAAAAGAGAVAALHTAARLSPIAPGLPRVPSIAVLAAAAEGLLVGVLGGPVGFGPVQASAVMATVTIGVLLQAPRVAVRFAGIRLPQLPRSADEMRIDVDPLPADRMAAQTARADQLLSGLVLGMCAFMVPALWVAAHAQDWPLVALAAVLTALVALRAREFLAVPQRVALAATAVAGLVALVDGPAVTGAPMRTVVLLLLAVAAAAAVATARRAPQRRLRPRWRQAVLISEGLLAASAVPLLLGALGVYAWARGLAG